MKLFSKLSISFSLVLTLFFLTLGSAFADTGSFTISNLVLSSGNTVLDFDYSGGGSDFTNSTNFTCSAIANPGDTIGYFTCNHHGALSCTSSHCTQTSLDTQTAIANGDSVHVSVFNLADDFHWSSQTFTWPLAAPSVLGSYTIPSQDTGAVGAMSVGSTTSFLKVFEANWPLIVTLSITILGFFFIYRIVMSNIRKKGIDM